MSSLVLLLLPLYDNRWHSDRWSAVLQVFSVGSVIRVVRERSVPMACTEGSICGG